MHRTVQCFSLLFGHHEEASCTETIGPSHAGNGRAYMVTRLAATLKHAMEICRVHLQ